MRFGARCRRPSYECASLLTPGDALVKYGRARVKIAGVSGANGVQRTYAQMCADD